MYQNKTHKTVKLILLSAVIIAGFSSCSKKANGVRASVKSEQTNLNPSVSSQADQQAAAMNATYKIATISVPDESTNSVNVELLNPSGQILPLTTTHANGKLISEGTYNDTQRGLQVVVQASCSADACYKYMIMVTVVRNNQALYQSIGISYKNDCKFNAVSASANVGVFLRTLQEVENKYQPRPQDDCSI
jgi:hypothetical protein